MITTTIVLNAIKQWVTATAILVTALAVIAAVVTPPRTPADALFYAALATLAMALGDLLGILFQPQSIRKRVAKLYRRAAVVVISYLVLAGTASSYLTDSTFTILVTVTFATALLTTFPIALLSIRPLHRHLDTRHGDWT